MLDLLGDDVLAGDAGDGAAHIGQQEVVQGPVPAAHARAHGLLLDVLRESCPLLGVLGVEGSGQVAHGVEGMLVALEEHLLGVFAEELTQAAVHGLLLGAAQIFAEDAVALVDQLPVDVFVTGQNDRTNVRCVLGSAFRHNQLHMSAFGQHIGQVAVALAAPAVRVLDRLGAGHAVRPAQLLGHQVGHGAGNRTEAEGAAAGIAQYISDMCYPDIAMKRAAIYVRVSTIDQNLETQLLDLHQMAAQRGYQIVAEFTDKLSSVKARRPGLEALMAEARRGKVDAVLVWASDRIARSTRHFLELLDEFNRLGIEYASFREQIDTGGPLGRAIVVIIGAIAELERSLIIERVRAGMRRARLEGQRLGRPTLALDREAILRDRRHGQSLGQLARSYRVSRTTIHRVLHEHPPNKEQVA